MLELGTTMTDGVRDKLTPVLCDGAAVASFRSEGWRETVAATVEGRSWAFRGTRHELVARQAADPEGTARFRAQRSGSSSDLWEVELHEVPVQMELVSASRGTHRFTRDGHEVASTSSSAWTAGLTLTAAPEVPLDQQVFLLWVALVTRRRNRSMAGI